MRDIFSCGEQLHPSEGQ